MNSFRIDRIGSGGDGVAEGPDGPVYVPFGLPGEIYERDAGGYFSLKGPDSEQRVGARCQHFGVCGGCIAQHMRRDVYEAWKRGLVAGAFNAQGLAAPDFSFVSVAPGSRRRCTLTAARARDGIRLGFHAAKSHDLIGLRECPVLMDAIVSRFDGLAAVANTTFGMMSKKAREGTVRLQVSALGGALDVAIDATGVNVDVDGRTQLADLAERHGFQRIAIGDDVVVLRDIPPLVTSAGVITPPPGAFFQAVESAERTMADAIVTGLGKSKRVADLFAGIGTFTLPIARKAR
ncbi:MAG: class I SAM-dependent RNA methyltransferase, partial [Hyphomicrobiaceae bacterium]